jgi:hypothetical protein
MKKCPFCAEEIQDEAIVCRSCGRELTPERVAEVEVSIGTVRFKPDEEVHIDDAKPPSVLGKAVIIGILLAGLAALPRIGVMVQPGVAYPSVLQDLALHFFLNWLGWTLVTALVLSVWRSSKGGAIFLASLVVVALVGIVYWPEIGEFLSAIRDPVHIQGDEAIQIESTQTEPTQARELSESESFIAYDEQLADWFGRAGSEITEIEVGRSNPRIAKLHIDAIRVEMRQYALPSSGLATHHDAFLNVVRGLSRAITPIAWFDTQNHAEYQARLQEAMILLDEAIADYADYGTSLGLDIWSRVCRDAPDHYRCK